MCTVGFIMDRGQEEVLLKNNSMEQLTTFDTDGMYVHHKYTIKLFTLPP